MYKLTGTEAQVLVPAPRLNAVGPASTATWQAVTGFQTDPETGELRGVYTAGSLFVRRAHVVLNGR